MLEVQNISKDYKEFHLRDITFSVKRGEYFVLLGPSGAGKTVLLEVIAGILEPDSGRVILNEKDVTKLPPERRGLSYVPQDYALFPNMSVFDNIAFGLKLRGVPRDERERKVRELAGVLGIDHLLHRNPRTLSGGEKQRVAIARALAVEPPLILLDEPFANLDVQTKGNLIREMKRWKKELNFTAIQVTHSFEEAVSLGDRVGVMLNGRLVQVGSVGEVFSKPASEEVARFLGFENIIEGVADGKVLVVKGIRIELPTAVRGRIRVGLRPEDIIISLKPIQSSARNELKATVEFVEELGPIARIYLRAGELRLMAYLTRSSLVEMGICEGKEVWASFKATALHVF
ncbi:tungstate ABC transporter ATP-binding protein WtpC [Thermococcus waiotapuensis]|uniref:Molybdate/tungstate import ATP-binding protein WtpC n=1 Tax=Thermococcus waiotapuensis TaxID=90909 RepID=A0AAE4SZH0_9EURY|nr:tungstate ABC transporter ATP-binding protein WtpC [Thermococcus waiotapuensis]MDV3104844.1 tungstate ABC transporter ATP-binding protein WtpC [Thermococcus waiotapuensis]